MAIIHGRDSVVRVRISEDCDNAESLEKNLTNDQGFRNQFPELENRQCEVEICSFYEDSLSRFD